MSPFLLKISKTYLLFDLTLENIRRKADEGDTLGPIIESEKGKHKEWTFLRPGFISQAHSQSEDVSSVPEGCQRIWLYQQNISQQ